MEIVIRKQKAKYKVTTGTNSLAIKSKTSCFTNMEVYDTGITFLVSNVMLEAAPQDITFENSSGAPCTLQYACDSKEDSLTAATETGGTQLLLRTALKCIKHGANISFSFDGNRSTTDGPVTSGKQD